MTDENNNVLVYFKNKKNMKVINNQKKYREKSGPNLNMKENVAYKKSIVILNLVRTL